MVTLLKLGGSLITDKQKSKTLHPEILRQLAQEVRAVLDEMPDLQLIVGHGSGSFGHIEAKRYDTIRGVETSEQWAGFASVSRIAAELNFHVATAFGNADVPVFRVQPSASAIARQGIIQDMAIQSILSALDHQLVPLVYGDVAFDEELGGTIVSTETVFRYLVSKLAVKRIFLLGEVDGVYDAAGDVIPKITQKNFSSIQSALGGSDGVDVTGGMLTKVRDMLDLASHAPYPEVTILNGTVPNRLQDALLGREVIGTYIGQ